VKKVDGTDFWIKTTKLDGPMRGAIQIFDANTNFGSQKGWKPDLIIMAKDVAPFMDALRQAAKEIGVGKYREDNDGTRMD
jgi:hypothetical protein